MSEQIKNSLWSLVENSNVYSFEKNPLPVFYLFTQYYLSISTDKTINDYPEQWKNVFEELKNSFDEVNDETKDFFRKFSWKLYDINRNESLLADVVNYFAEKFFMLKVNSCANIVLTQKLESFIYWYAAGTEACTTELAIYNPYAQFATWGKMHANGLGLQLRDSLYWDTMNERHKSISLFKEHSWYHGIENDSTDRLIGCVNLLVNNPINLEQMFIHCGDFIDDDIDGFYGNWTLISTPPTISYKEPDSSLVQLITKLVEKFANAEGMYDAFLILPKYVCYDNAFSNLRRKIVCKGLLASVIELPEEAFKTPSNHVLFHLSKSEYECGTKFINAIPFFEKDNDNHLLYICIENEQSEYSKIIGDYTVAQCDYCLLPSIYVKPEEFESDNEDLHKFHEKFQNLLDSQQKSEKKRQEHRDISGQLSHMLGATYHKISDAISELKYTEGQEETYCILRDSFDYMKRLINTVDEDFTSADMILEELAVNKFMESYIQGWSVYGKKNFKVIFETDVSDNTTFKVNDVFLKVLLDALLENANRHGFGDGDIQNPQIKIMTSYAIVNNTECIKISVANNGIPFPDSFTLEQYIREGEFGGKSGHTGRGGYHVYQITKRHKGYLALNGDSEWNVNFDIMIPVEYYQECETEKFKVYGKEYM